MQSFLKTEISYSQSVFCSCPCKTNCLFFLEIDDVARVLYLAFHAITHADLWHSHHFWRHPHQYVHAFLLLQKKAILTSLFTSATLQPSHNLKCASWSRTCICRFATANPCQSHSHCFNIYTYRSHALCSHPYFGQAFSLRITNKYANESCSVMLHARFDIHTTQAVATYTWGGKACTFYHASSTVADEMNTANACWGRSGKCVCASGKESCTALCEVL